MADDASTRLDRRRDGLFRQLGLINGGVVYIYCVTGPRGAGHARLASTRLSEPAQSADGG